MDIQEHIQLAPYTNYKIGGPARYFVVVHSVDELRDAIAAAKERRSQPLFLSGGTNLLIPDEGIDRFVIKLEIEGFEFRESSVHVYGGTNLQVLVDAATQRSLGGLEWAGGLPGSVGGGVRGNAGAFGGEFKDIVTTVEAMTEAGEITTYHAPDCQFGYRESIFKHNPEAIVAVTLSLYPASQDEIAAVVERNRQYRRDRHPLEYPNAGSTFKNIPVEQLAPAVLAEFSHKVKHDPFPVLPVAVLIAAANLKGYRVGNAAVSEKHTNYIVNLGDATAADVRAVIAHVKATLRERYGVEPEEEILVL